MKEKTLEYIKKERLHLQCLIDSAKNVYLDPVNIEKVLKTIIEMEEGND